MLELAIIPDFTKAMLEGAIDIAIVAVILSVSEIAEMTIYQAPDLRRADSLAR